MSEMTPMSTLTERIGALAQLKELKNEIAENLKSCNAQIEQAEKEIIASMLDLADAAGLDDPSGFTVDVAGRRYDFNPRSPHGERLRKVTILSIRIIGFAQKVYHKTVLLRISLAENAVILPEKPRNPVRTSLQKAGGLRFARAIRAARPYSISSPSGA